MRRARARQEPVDLKSIIDQLRRTAKNELAQADEAHLFAQIPRELSGRELAQITEALKREFGQGNDYDFAAWNNEPVVGTLVVDAKITRPAPVRGRRRR